LRQYCQIALAKCLIKTDKPTAISLINSCDLAIIKDDEYDNLRRMFVDHLSNDVVREIFKPRNLNIPILHDKVIQDKGMQHVIHDDIIGFLDQLKLLHVYSKEAISALRLKVGMLNSPAIDFYSAIFELYDIWASMREQSAVIANKITKSKKALKGLFVRKKSDHERRNRGLFDYDTTPSFIRYSIKNLYREFFEFFKNMLDTTEMEELITFWLALEEGSDGYKHYSNALIIAEVLAKDLNHKMVTKLPELLKHAEKLARYDSETRSLTDSLAEVSQCYGLCGFSQEAKRIYEELIDVAFGVGYRKDYQVTNIIEPMELMHEIDPDGSPGRLADVLYVQEKLADAGNNRMNHISLSYFASFASKIAPDLAFKLLEFEEKNLARDESMEIVLRKMIASCKEEELTLYLALIKTLPRWDTGGTSKNEFITLAEKLFARAIHYRSESIIKEILALVKYNTTVETNNSKDFESFGNILKNEGIAPSTYGIPESAEIKKEDAKTPLTQSEKFAIRFKRRDTNDVVTLFNTDYPRLLDVLKADMTICIHNRRHGT
ncbi:MAG: hypothetical protein K2Q33_07400, partial [Gammaproteobacteria bacterium]|nr:hypothetical protein [Gammaproteobacteria bacterium]